LSDLSTPRPSIFIGGLIFYYKGEQDMPKPTILTTPEIDPETGHEKDLPNPRPRDEIFREMLASTQADPSTHLYDIYYRLQFIMRDLSVLVEKEIANEKSTARKRRK